jgi:hypothetical protein
MTDLDDRAGLCSAVTLSNDKAPSPIQARPHPHPPAPAAWEPLMADAWPIADPGPSRLGGMPLPRPHTPRPAPFVHADLKPE